MNSETSQQSAPRAKACEFASPGLPTSLADLAITPSRPRRSCRHPIASAGSSGGGWGGLLLQCFYLGFRLHRDESGIVPIITVVPVDPFVPLIEIELAALAALIQAADEMAAVFITFDPFQALGERAALQTFRLPP